MFAQADPAVLFFSPDGALQRAWGNGLEGAHGLTLIEENGEERLWLTDQYSGAVMKTKLDGTFLQSIARPEGISNYSPTWAAVNPDNGDIWVADGYGSSIIRRYDRHGRYLMEITGDEGPGRFARPHGIAFNGMSRLFIADRRNQRILVYDGEGQYVCHRDGITHSPCGFFFDRDAIFIPELFGALKVFDSDWNLLSEIGANYNVRPPGGWPDQQGWGWPLLPGWPDGQPPQDRQFTSPHAVAVSPDGDIYVAEWMVGGRITKLKGKPNYGS